MTHSIPRRQKPGWRIARRPLPPPKPKGPAGARFPKKGPSRIKPGAGR